MSWHEFLWICFVGVCSASWICRFASFARSGRFLVIAFSSTLLDSLSFFSSRTLMIWILHLLNCHTGPESLLNFFSRFFSLLFRLGEFYDLSSIISALLLYPSSEGFFFFFLNTMFFISIVFIKKNLSCAWSISLFCYDTSFFIWFKIVCHWLLKDN